MLPFSLEPLRGRVERGIMPTIDRVGGKRCAWAEPAQAQHAKTTAPAELDRPAQGWRPSTVGRLVGRYVRSRQFRHGGGQSPDSVLVLLVEHTITAQHFFFGNT